MSQNSNDLRVRRMRKLLREALIELIEERGFDAITVGEIAQRALVSRAAFYRYYQDKYDLAEQIFDEAMQTLIHDLGSPPRDLLSNIDLERMPEPWVKLFEHIAEYERFYRVLLGAKGNAWFVTKMRASLVEMMNERLLELTRYPDMMRMLDKRVFAEGFAPTLIAGVLVDAIIWWLEQERSSPPRQVATYSYHLVFTILKEVTTWEC